MPRRIRGRHGRTPGGSPDSLTSSSGGPQAAEIPDRRDRFAAMQRGTPKPPPPGRRAALRQSPVPPGDETGAAELTARVAFNLREQRRRRDMSLDDLAQLTGVSRAALS